MLVHNKAATLDNTRNEFGYSNVKSVLLLFFSYAVSFNVCNSIHELGHGIVHWIKGEVFAGFVFHPFITPRIVGADITSLGIENFAAGWITSLLICTLLSIVFWKERSASTLPLIMCGPVAWILEGVNIATGPLSYGSDGDWFIRLTGIPGIVLMILGLVIMSLGFFFFSQLLPLLDLSPEDRNVPLVIFAGLLLYIALMVLYVNLFYPVDFEIKRANINLIAGMLSGGIIAVLFKKVSYHGPLVPQIKRKSLTWKNLGMPGLLAVMVVVFGLVFFN